jgi:hypothetical protein
MSMKSLMFLFSEIQQDMTSLMKFLEVPIQNLVNTSYPEEDVYQSYAEMNPVIPQKIN